MRYNNAEKCLEFGFLNSLGKKRDIMSMQKEDKE